MISLDCAPVSQGLSHLFRLIRLTAPLILKRPLFPPPRKILPLYHRNTKLGNVLTNTIRGYTDRPIAGVMGDQWRACKVGVYEKKGLQPGLYGMDQSLHLRGKRRPKSDLSVKATFYQRVKV